MCGDFNIVRFTQEKSSGRRETNSTKDFNSFIWNTGLLEKVCWSSIFTWSDFRSNPAGCNLDKFLFLHEKEPLVGPNVKQEICQKVIFDHYLVFLSTETKHWGSNSFYL